MSPIILWSIVLGIIFLIAYIVLGFVVGRKAGRSVESYLAANRNIGFVVTLFAVIAAWFSGYTFLGLFGASYRTGMGAYIQAHCVSACAISMILLGVPTWFLGKKYGYVSQTDLLSERYESKNIGLLYGVLWIILIVAYIMTNMIGAGALLTGISAGYIPYWVGVVVSGTAMLAYLLFGGMRSMAWVNAIQGIILTFVLWVSIYILFLGAGGNMVEIVNRIIHTPFEKMLTIPGLIPLWTYGQWFFLGIFGLTWGAFPQMFPSWYAARNPKIIVLSVLITSILIPIYYFHSAFGGIMGRLINPHLSGPATDSSFPFLIAQLAPPWFIGLFFAGTFAAMISTVAALAMSAASIGARSIYKTHINPQASEGQQILASRITLTVVVALAIIFSIYKPPFIMTIGMLFFAGGLNLSLAVWGAYYWPRSNKYGVYAGTIVGFGLLIIQVAMGKLQVSWWGMHPGLIAFIPNLIFFVVVSLLTPRPSPEVVNKFHGYLGEKLKLLLPKR